MLNAFHAKYDHISMKIFHTRKVFKYKIKALKFYKL